MTNRRNEVWTEAEYATLQEMLAAGYTFPEIARVLRRAQTDVASGVQILRGRGYAHNLQGG